MWFICLYTTNISNIISKMQSIPHFRFEISHKTRRTHFYSNRYYIIHQSINTTNFRLVKIGLKLRYTYLIFSRAFDSISAAFRLASNRNTYGDKKSGPQCPLQYGRTGSEPYTPCGDGGSRTLVQTRNPNAFYTLIFHLVLTPAAVRKPPKPRAAFRRFRTALRKSRRTIPVCLIPRKPFVLPDEAERRGTRRHAALGATIKVISIVKLRSECIA